MILDKSFTPFLKASECKTNDVIQIADGGVKRESTKWKYTVKETGEEKPKMEYIFQVKMANGDMKTLTMNKVSRDALKAKWGEDTDKWVGKNASIFIMPTPNGKQMIVLNPME